MIKALLLIASTPVFALATPQNDAQKPLQAATPDIIHTLKLNSALQYTIQFPFAFPSDRIAPLSALQDPFTYSGASPPTAIFNIPADATETGSLTITTSAITTKQDEDMLFFPLTYNSAFRIPHMRASRIPLHTLSIRRGGSISMAAQAAEVNLDTPFITLPEGIWDVLVLATRPQGEGMRVECGRRDVFPDLVLVSGEDEIVVSPGQYVLEREGRCELLVRKAKDGEEEEVVGLGWAALRGRKFVVDGVGGRMGVSI